MVKFNDAAMRDLEKKVKANAAKLAKDQIAKLDKSARARYGGRPVSEIKGPLGAHFKSGGLTLPDSDLSTYAAAVSQNLPFRFNVKAQ